MIWLLIGYLFLFIHRPFEVWPVLGTFRIELIYMLFTGAVWLVYPRKQFTLDNTHLAILGFATAVALCAMVSPWSEHCWPVVENYFKLLVFYLLVVTTVRGEKDVKRLVLGLAVVMTLYMFHSLWEFRNGRYVHRMGIDRLIGVDTTCGDPNSFGASIVLALVFLPALWRSHGTWVRVFLMGNLGLGLVCIILTGSRGSLVILALWALVTLLRSRWRWGLLLASLLAVPVMWGAMPDRLQTRFETIIDPSVGPANAQSSAEERLVGLQVGLQLWSENPLLGVGPGAYRAASGRSLQPHNLYGQLLGELGTVGGLAFAALVGSFFANILWIRRACRARPNGEQEFLFALAGSVGLGLFLMLFQGSFGHNLFRYNWVWFGALLVIARLAVMNQEQAQDDCGSDGGWEAELDTPIDEAGAATTELVEAA